MARSLVVLVAVLAMARSGIAGVTHAIPNSATPVRMSADGRYVAYARALATPFGALPPGVDFMDRATGMVTEVAPVLIGPPAILDPNVPGDQSSFKGLSISANGRVVAFASGNATLVSPDANGSVWDVYVRDMDTGVLSRVSVSSTAVQANGQCAFPSLSADGRYVAFSSDASNLVPNDTNGHLDVFVHDRSTGTTERVNVASDGSQSTGDVSSINSASLAFCHCPSISADGRYVAFWSIASDLVPGDTNGNFDAFVHDRMTGETTRVSVKSDGSESHPVVGPVHVGISGDGRYVGFESRTNDLDPRKTTPSNVQGVFVHDRVTGVTELVSLNSAGESANAIASGDPFLSYDGRFVTFQSTADNLVPGDTNGMTDAFLRDRLLGTTERINVSSTGLAPGETVETLDQTSDDGRFVSFQTYNDLDPDAFGDAYVRDRTCANGVVEGTESCDDANLIDTDACDTSCRPTGCGPSICGDGVVGGCEECDGGPGSTDECCSASCTFRGRGTACADDGSVCTADACDGAGACVHPSRSASVPCDDGVFCNGTDHCSAGSCSQHSGDPCLGLGECVAACDEATHACDADPTGTACSDDGNPCTLDACDANQVCTHSPAPAGTPCDDGNPCTTGDSCQGGSCDAGAPVVCPLCERCDAANGCVVAPRMGCKVPTAPRKASLTVQDAVLPTRDLAKWKWTRGEDTSVAELGDPLADDAYALCVYDAGNALRLRLTAPAGGTCRAVSCWKVTGGSHPSGFKYRNPDRSDDGMDTLTMKAGVVTRAKVSLKGRGEKLLLPSLDQLAVPLLVQMQGENGVCFEATFSQSGILSATPEVFRARSD